MSITKSDFGFYNGYKCHLFTLINKNGMIARLTNFGGTLLGLEVPDKNGNLADVVLGYDDIKGYAEGGCYQGALVGRYANRIGNGKLKIAGKEYQLALNENNVCHLHGGNVCYNKRVWTVEGMTDGDEPSVTFGYISPDGEENYPGTLKISVTYTLSANNALVLDYKATSDAETVINLTNHAYFNLRGAGNGTIKDHIAQINASKYTPVDDILVPLGEDAPVAGTPFDLTKPTRIGECMDNGTLPFGYDHNFILNDKAGIECTAAEVYEPESGRVMTVKTNLPAIQFYIGVSLDIDGKNGNHFGNYTGFCLETQFSPDTPNRPQLPSCTFKAGELYHFTTSYEFSVR